MSNELGDTNGTAAQAPALLHVNWREVILFVLLAYSLAWVWWGFWLFPYLGTLLTQSTTPMDLLGGAGVAMVLGMFAPMIAALIMRLFVSKEGVKGSLASCAPGDTIWRRSLRRSSSLRRWFLSCRH